MRQQLLFLAKLAALLLPGASQAQGVSFGPATAYATAPGSDWATYWAVLADVNADGRPDAVALTLNYVTYASQVAVLLGTATGTLQAPAYYGAGQGSKFLAVADLNADGKPDVVTSDQFSSQVSVLLNSGSGTFQPAVAYSTGPNSNPGEVVVADLNADGKPDLVVAAGGIVVLRGTGNGTFQAAASYATGYYNDASRLAVADVNADGRPDVVTTDTPSGILVLLNSGTGALQAPLNYSAGLGYVHSLAAADLNTDGRPDILTAGGASVGVLLGSAGASWQPLVQYPLAGVVAINDVAVADVNGDGRPDALTANYALAATASVLPGTGTGALQPVATFTVGPANCLPSWVGAADLNADGRPDLVTANLSNNTLSVLLNTTPLAARAALPGVQIQLCPNPAGAASPTLALTGLPTEVQQVQATLLDATGRVAARAELAARQGTARAELPTANLAPGLYLVHLAASRQPGEPGGLLPTQRLLVR